ncbi:hypothetical protein [Mucilaginibacter sp. 3215]|uniref:hypothetical protein n=1 Tax=Mucilaginibacter sp. 3215 TaxID=3373912 RepID=UPI003D1BA73C
MKDILNLTDNSIPISKRYDDFLIWSNQNTSIVPDVIAEKLEVDSSVVDVFHQLGELEDEFKIIDEKKIDIATLFILVRYDNPEARAKVYDNAETLLADPQPMKAVREFLENLVVPDYSTIINQVSANAWAEVSKALKARDIVAGTITKQFRSMLITAAGLKRRNEPITPKMCDWILRAINVDVQQELRIFSSETLINDFTTDFNHFESLRELAVTIATS